MPKLPPALAKASLEEERMPAEEHAQRRRREILASVTDVFAKRGYQGATIDHLVAGGKTSMGGFYKLFDGKEDCFVQAFDQVVDEATVDAPRPGDAQADWGARVSACLLALLEFAAAKPFSARLVLLEAQSGGPEAVRRYNELLGEAAAGLRAGRSESSATPDLPASFEDATVSGIVWLMQNRLARGTAIDVDELHPQLTKMVLEPYLGRKALTKAMRRR
ncbi:MAG TPA: TetR/AcrR family transcriptional regulator [Solirubrobacterales bacterium]|jgi:AcrR family transcriptional regulator